MNITLNIPLIIYLIFLLVFFVFIFINVYHLVASASLTTPSFVFTFFILVATIIALYFTTSVLINIDWQQSLFGTGNSGFSSDPF